MATHPEMRTEQGDTAQVDAWFAGVEHALLPELQALRKIILAADKSVGEQIKWNHPTFIYTGPMGPFPPKEYRRVLIVSNVLRPKSKTEGILLVFWNGARIKDSSGLLRGDFADGRRVAYFRSMDEIMAGKRALTAVVRQLVRSMVAQ